MNGVEEEADVPLCATKHCTQCRIGFTPAGVPIYPAWRSAGDSGVVQYAGVRMVSIPIRI